GCRRFGDGGGAGDGVDRRVASAETIALVHLERDAGGGSHERRRAGVRLRTVAEQRGDAVGRARGRKPREVAVLGQRTAGDDGAERVEQDALAGLDGGFGKRVDAHLGRDLGESIEVVGHWSEGREAGALRGWRALGTAWLRPTKTRPVTGDPSADCAAERRPRPRAREVPAVARLLLELARRGEPHLTPPQRHPRPATHLPALVG